MTPCVDIRTERIDPDTGHWMPSAFTAKGSWPFAERCPMGSIAAAEGIYIQVVASNEGVVDAKHLLQHSGLSLGEAMEMSYKLWQRIYAPVMASVMVTEGPVLVGDQVFLARHERKTLAPIWDMAALMKWHQYPDWNGLTAEGMMFMLITDAFGANSAAREAFYHGAQKHSLGDDAVRAAQHWREPTPLFPIADAILDHVTSC